MISLFRMIELVGQKVLAAALIVGLSLGFGFLPAVLAKKYLQHSQKSICSTYKKIFTAHTKKDLQYSQKSIGGTYKNITRPRKVLGHSCRKLSELLVKSINHLFMSP